MLYESYFYNADKEAKKDCRIAWGIIYADMLILSNVKFTGLLYGGCACICFFVIWFYTLTKKNNKFRLTKTVWIYIGLFGVLAVLCVGWIGYPTYINNFIDHKSFTYPLTGENRVDIITYNSPAGFMGTGNLFQFFYGFFGKTNNLVYNIDRPLPKLKIPFMFDGTELTQLSSIDLRIGGFGIFFSGLVICVIIAEIILAIKKKKYWPITVVVIFLGCSVLIPAGWWARYNPFMWLIPVNYLMHTDLDKKGLFNKMFVLLIVINTILFVRAPWDTVHKSVDDSIKLGEMKNMSLELYLRGGDFSGKLFDFEDNDISVYYNKNLLEEGEVSYIYDEPYKLKDFKLGIN